MARQACYSFESTGHKFRPLDGLASIVYRLYCRSCGRVVLADNPLERLVSLAPDLPAELDPELPTH